KAEESVRARAEAEAKAKAEEEAKKRAEQETQRLAEEEAKRRQAAEAKKATTPAGMAAAAAAKLGAGAPAEEEEEARPRRPGHHAPPRRPTPGRGREEPRRRTGKITVTEALSEEETLRVRSLAAMKRAREKERLRLLAQGPAPKIVRDVVIPEAITVQELANRMA